MARTGIGVQGLVWNEVVGKGVAGEGPDGGADTPAAAFTGCSSGPIGVS